MVYTALAGIVVVVGIFVFLAAGRLLFGGRWVQGWLRGMLGITLLAGAAILALSAFDFYSYQPFSKEQAIANLSFNKISSQHFQVSVVDSSGVEQVHELSGDLWQLDARVIKWNDKLVRLGLAAGYRIDRLSGRYYSLEQERSAPRTVYQLANSKSALDVWSLLREYGRGLAIVDASYGSATYLPMADGALFSVSLSNTGLLARPLNDRAKLAIENWQ